MDNLEQKLNNLSKQKLSFSADIKIKSRLYILLSANIWAAFKIKLTGLNLAYKIAAPAFLVLVIALGVTSFYAYADDEVVPGHKLYPLKQTVEGIEEKLTFTPAAKVELYEKFSQKRLAEALNLSQSDLMEKPKAEKEKINENIEKTIDNAIVNIGSAAQSSLKAEIKTETPVTRINLPVEDKLKAQADEKLKIDYLDKIEENAKSQKNESLVKKVGQAKTTIKNYSKFFKFYKRGEIHKADLATTSNEAEDLNVNKATSSEEESSEQATTSPDNGLEKNRFMEKIKKDTDDIFKDRNSRWQHNNEKDSETKWENWPKEKERPKPNNDDKEDKEDN